MFGEKRRMKFQLESLPRNCTDEEIIIEIKRVDSILNHNVINQADFNKLARITAQTVAKRFGGWEQALTAAGLVNKYSGTRITSKMRQQSKSLSDEDILNELKRIASDLGRDFVTQKDVNTFSEIISSSTVVYRFKNWEAGLSLAGLKTSPDHKKKIGNEEYFENLLNVWTHYGRQPKYAEMSKPPSSISPAAYANRFGSWYQALKVFVESMNSEEPILKESKFDSAEISDSAINQSRDGISEFQKKLVCREQVTRSISVSLRYKILNRDNFKCAKCGSSPAVEFSCKLHVDHIIPFSKGGQSTFENLQTLCQNCNLGKSNRYNE